jgi:hypothetical protein
MLVLLDPRRHDPLPYTTPLPACQIAAASVETWEDNNSGGVRVLLADLTWEKRLVQFLEPSRVGRVMAEGTDEDGAYAARMDEWVALETVKGTTPSGER